jgi:NAD(P) transhydrogenase subunit alpha
MKPGSVIVDLAAEQGGNCVLTQPGKVVQHKGVTIIGYTDLPSRMASMASQLYGSTLVALLEELMDDNGELAVDLEDEVVRGSIVLAEGKMMWPPPAPVAPPPPEPGVPTKSTAAQAVPAAAGHGSESSGPNPILLIVAALLLIGIGYAAPASTLSHFTVFILAIFVGWQVIWNVKPALHTPLMSVTNAISGIILVGGMLQLSGASLNLTTILGAVAVLIAAINIAGGFLVTNRMLGMFRK